MTEELRELRYRTKSSIRVPSNIALVEGLLQWDVEYDANGKRDFSECSVSRCLEEFAALAEATEAEILAFTQRHGVLGVMPDVWMSEGSCRLDARHRTSCRVTYEESPRIYARMALIVRHIRATMHYVRTGRKVNGREAELFRQVTRYAPDKIEYKSQAEAHRAVQRVVRAWQKVASLSLGLWPSDLDNNESISCDFWLDFGTWEQGHEWDQRFGGDSQNDSQRTLYNHYNDASPDGQSAMEHLYRFSSQSDWLNTIPSSSCRPSPLFSVLALQLIQEIALPRDHYFCSRCGRTYPYNETTKEAGASRPRSDRLTSFCHADCRAARKREDDSIRHKNKKPTIS